MKKLNLISIYLLSLLMLICCSKPSKGPSYNLDFPQLMITRNHRLTEAELLAYLDAQDKNKIDFEGYKITSIEISNSRGLEDFEISEDLKSIKFKESQISDLYTINIVLEKFNQVDAIVTEGKLFVSSRILYKSNGTILEGFTDTFNLDGSIKNIITTIPDKFTSIGDRAFLGNRWLRSINIPGSVISIGADAFDTNQGLLTVTLNQGIKNIKDEAFYYCGNLKSITIPNSVTSIGSQAFYRCTKLVVTVKQIDPGKIKLGNAAFGRENNTNSFYVKQIKVPEGSLNKYRSDSNWSIYPSKILSN